MSNQCECNTGKDNTGHWNSGNRNSGDWNSGDRNSGDWNSGDWNSGYFNTDTPDTVLAFGEEVLREVWDSATKPSFLFFDLNVWVSESDMTEQEKTDNPKAHVTGGYLKTMSYKEAFRASFDALSTDEKKEQLEQLLSLPNFCADKFEHISGICILAEDEKLQSPAKEMTVAEIEAALGYEVKVIADGQDSDEL